MYDLLSNILLGGFKVAHAHGSLYGWRGAKHAFYTYTGDYN